MQLFLRELFEPDASHGEVQDTAAQYEFDAGGNYRLGLPAGNAYAMQPSVHDLDAFLSKFEKLVEVEADTFTTEHKHGRSSVYTRGACN